MKKIEKKPRSPKKKKSVKIEFKMGDEVLVESLTVTKPRHGINRHMQQMVGNQYTVHDIGQKDSYDPQQRVTLKTEKNDTWMFAPEDLILITDANRIQSEAMPTHPIMFDPNELV